MFKICFEPAPNGWWHAYFDPYHKGNPRGYGSTELSAAEDLLAARDDHEAASEWNRYLTETGQLL